MNSLPFQPVLCRSTCFVLLAAILLSPIAGCGLLGLDDSGGDEDPDPSPPPSIEFFQNHPSSSALYVTRADTVLAAYRADREQPLASTVKYTVAIEYARQAAAGTIRPDSLVPLDHINRFMGLTGPTAKQLHQDWIDQARDEDRVQNGQVSLRTVARGMIKYSSNPATEYLMDLLTLTAINQGLSEIGLQRHDRLHYLVSDLYVGVQEGLEGEERAQFMRDLTAEERASRAAQIHRKLAQDDGYSYRDSLTLPGPDVQRAWSDYLPASTAREYGHLMQQINDRALMTEEAHGYLHGVLEVKIDNPRYSHAGLKGGSTTWVFTQAAFFTEKQDGTQTEYVVLLDGSPKAQNRLSDLNDDFGKGLMNDPSYRRTLAQTLGGS